jgi:hypothetical protein
MWTVYGLTHAIDARIILSIELWDAGEGLYVSDQIPQTTAAAQTNTPSAEIIREFNDRGTLWLLEDPAHLRSLIQILEPELAGRLDTEHAERVNRSFIPADLQKEESDLIFRIPFRTDDGDDTDVEVLIYVLLEHQSKPDPLMGLRLFLYLGELWDTQLREWRDAQPTTPLRLLPVVPMVFYTGLDNWNTPINISGLMNLPQTLQRFIPTWETLFLNLHRTPSETLTQFATAVGYALHVLQAEKKPLAELEQVLREAMAGLEGLTAEQSGQWLRVAWYLVLLTYHRRERPEYNELVDLIQAAARGSKFRERTEVENMAESMAQWVEKKAKSEEACSLLLRLGIKRFGAPDAQTLSMLAATTELEAVERLVDRLLEVETWQELLA